MWPFREELLGFFQTFQERANQRLFRVSQAWPSWGSILCWLAGSLSSFGHWRNTVSQKDPKYLNAHHPSSRKISKLDSLCLKREIQLKKARKVTGLRFSSLRIMISFKPCVHAHLVMCDPMDWSPPGSSVHGISQARVLEQVASSFSRGSSP